MYQNTDIQALFFFKDYKSTRLRDNKCFHFQTTKVLFWTTDFFGLRVHMTTSALALSRNYGFSKLRIHRTATDPDRCLLSVVLQSKQPATAQKSVVRSLLSVVLKEQISLREGIREVGQMRKRMFFQQLTTTYALRFGFAKIRRRKLPLSTYVHLCPLMSTYVHLFLLKHTILNIYKIEYLHRLATRCS